MLFPVLSDLLVRVDAPIAIVELPRIGSSYRFGPQEIDGQLWSVDAETVQGFQAHAVARTIRRLGVRIEDTQPDSLLATTLGQFLVAQSSAGADSVSESGDMARAVARMMEFGDVVRTEIERAERTTVGLRVADEWREVLAVHCRDYTGVTTELAGNTVVAVLPTAHLRDARLGAITSV